MDKFQVYLASGFFNPEQIKVVKNLERILTEAGLKVFSPMRDNFCPAGADERQSNACFLKNIRAIEESDFILARIDAYDAGVMFECGYAKCYGIPIIYYTTETRSKGMNLMLAQSAYGYIQGEKNLRLALEWAKKNSEKKSSIAYEIHSLYRNTNPYTKVNIKKII